MTVTFRIWIDGTLRTTEEHDSNAAGFDLEEIRARHERLVEQCDKPWMIEVEIPEGPPEGRFLRFGTDPSAMRAPVPADDLRGHPWAI